jgi:hypothetical protein
MKLIKTVALVFAVLCVTSPAHAVVDLATLLGNSGFESDLVHSQWKATRPNSDFLLDAPQVNPEIIPKDEVNEVVAPIGAKFIGILNPNDENVEGKLVHDAVLGDFPVGTVFEITIWGNRGRLSGASNAGSLTSEVLVQLYGWGAGALPTINQSNDNWSRQPSVKVIQKFTNWAPTGGDWASQVFQLVTTKALKYVTLGITGKNHKQSSYVAFDTD